MARRKGPVEFRGPVPIDLATIDDDMRPAAEMRVALSVEAVKEYAGILTEMPPVKLMWDAKEEKHWVVDGAHTLTAFAGSGQHIVQAMAAEGDYLDAFAAAAKENLKRGVRITPADMRIRVERACRTLPGIVKDWPWSGRRLAELCGVHKRVAEEILEWIQGETGEDVNAPRTALDGKKYTPVHESRNGKALDRSEVGIGPPQNPRQQPFEDRVAPSPPIPTPKPKPSPYEGFRRVLDDIHILIGSINAPDNPDQQGWGGFGATLARCTPWERTHVRNYVRALVESLQEWQREMEGIDHEGEGHEA